MARRLLGVLVLLWTVTNGFAAPAAEANLASHRAAYSLSLGAAKITGVSAIDGAMSVDWQETCDGWTMAQRMRFRVFDADGESISTGDVYDQPAEIWLGPCAESFPVQCEVLALRLLG